MSQRSIKPAELAALASSASFCRISRRRFERYLLSKASVKERRRLSLKHHIRVVLYMYQTSMISWR